MPLVAVMKGKNKTYMIADKCQYVSGSKFERMAPRQYSIQRFKNFVVAYEGGPVAFQKFVKEVDFDSFPEPLTRSFLFRNFYKKYLEFASTLPESNVVNGALRETEFNIMIMGNGYAFDICGDYLYEVRTINANGGDRMAFTIYDTFSDEMDEEVLVQAIMDMSDKYGNNVSYPFMMVTSDNLDEMTIINRNGSKRKEMLQQLWRKQ